MSLLDADLQKKLLDQMICLVVTDKEGRYIYANKEWERTMKADFADVEGKYVVDVVKNSKINDAIKRKRTITDHSTIIVDGAENDAYSAYIPIIENQKVIAAAIITLFTGNDRQDYVRKIEALLKEMTYYKYALNQIRGAKYSIDDIVGSSPAVAELKRTIQHAARSKSTVLIEGETGSGKELVAHAIHQLSSRRSEPFIKVNCAGIPNELLESEFFGYEAGAFTGASRGGYAGKFEQANKGSLFLDEVEQLAMSMQPKFLRVLQEGEIERLRGTKTIPVDVRIIAASNANLEEMVSRKTFRSDLFYRLNVLKITIPPLRKRISDIPELTDLFVDELNKEYGLYISPVSDEIKEMLMEYDWPGNVRELRNVIERAMIMSNGNELKPRDFSDHLAVRNKFDKNRLYYASVPDAAAAKEQTERERILNAVYTSRNKSEAAKKLGFSRTTLYKKLHQYDIDV